MLSYCHVLTAEKRAAALSNYFWEIQTVQIVVQMRVTVEMHRYVIIGGGAGGLVLATQLGKRLGKAGLAQVTLVDGSRTHIWKPLLHQLAAGTFDTHAEEIEFLAQARWNSFKFRLGNLVSVDRGKKTIQLAPSLDAAGKEYMSAQELSYDTLVLAVGSKTNDFGTAGAALHAVKLDSPQAALAFHETLLEAMWRDQTEWARDADVKEKEREKGKEHDKEDIADTTSGNSREPRPGISIAIVGGGATGVELAAELHSAAKVLGTYGFDHIDPERDMKITLVEAAPRLLPPLPERLSAACLTTLNSMKIDVKLNARVTKVTQNTLELASGEVIRSSICVWAAGVKASAFLKTLGGPGNLLETNKVNQIIVNGHLQSTVDANIFAFGDCAACVQPNGSFVPARAQAAYQQAMYLADVLPTLTSRGASASKAARVPEFVYVDKGSLVVRYCRSSDAMQCSAVRYGAVHCSAVEL